MLSTQQIQSMLEENYELFTKIASATPAQKQEPQTKAVLEECNKALHENLMKLAGQADTNMTPAQPAAVVAAAAAATAGVAPAVQAAVGTAGPAAGQLLAGAVQR